MLVRAYKWINFDINQFLSGLVKLIIIYPKTGSNKATLILKQRLI